VLLGRDHPVGHGEQDVVFLGDVLAQEGGVAAGVLDDGGLRPLVPVASFSAASRMARVKARPWSCSPSMTAMGPCSFGIPHSTIFTKRTPSSL